MKEKPNFRMIDIAADAGPGKMLWVLDKLIKAEAQVRTEVAEAV